MGEAIDQAFLPELGSSLHSTNEILEMYTGDFSSSTNGITYNIRGVSSLSYAATPRAFKVISYRSHVQEQVLRSANLSPPAIELAHVGPNCESLNFKLHCCPFLVEENGKDDIPSREINIKSGSRNM